MKNSIRLLISILLMVFSTHLLAADADSNTSKKQPTHNDRSLSDIADDDENGS